MRTHLLRRPLRALYFAGLLLGLAPSSQAFTLITTDPVVKKVSVGAPPADGPSQTSIGPRYSISDGSLACQIVFTSTAKNLVTGQTDTNGASDVFLYDCVNDKVVALVSHNSGGLTAAANGTSDQPVISPDGNFVVFRSTANDIVAGGAGFLGQTNVFLYDVQNGTNTLVSHASFSLTTAGNGNSRNGVISRAAGRPLVAFESFASNLVVPDDNGVSDVFRFNSADSSVNIVSVPNPGLPAVQSNGGSINPVIDSLGNCVVYQSLATNLVSDQPAVDDTNGAADVFRWVSGAGPATILLSHQAGKPNSGRGAVTGDGASTEPSVSDNCQQFAFKSSAKNLAPGQAENNAGDDIFHERNAGDAALASHVDGSPNKTGSDVSASPILSRDGNWIAYASRAIDLSPGQTDSAGTSDVFVYDIAADKNTLASHAAGDPKKAASAQSFAPEISTEGLYVAFTSDAKDIDPNQNDGNVARDVFLYNRRWNSSVVASRRFASIAITGDGRSIVPALSGDGYLVAFTSNSDDLIADDPETAGLDDVFFFRSIGRMNYASVRSTDSQNSLEWITPATNIVTMQAWVNPGTTCPTDYVTASAGTLLPLPAQVPSNESFLVTDPLVYFPGFDVCYSFFIERDSGPIQPGDGPAKSILARTLDTSGPVKWASNVAGVAALAQVGIGAQNLIAVANEGGVYGIDRGPAGGFWSSGYWPFRTDTFPIQGRPGVLTLSVKGSTHTTFVGSQDSRVYAFDADRGARAGGALWYTAPVFPSGVQPGIGGMFTFFGGVGNHLLFGTGLTSGFGYFFAFDPATGLQRTGSPFSGGPFSIGAINTTASVDYARAQVYFASLEFPAGQPSLWCLKLTATGFGGTCWSQTSPSPISGGAIERNGTVYAGDDSGQVWAFDASTGLSHWAAPYTACGGGAAIKSFVLADRQGTGKDLYYATTNGLCAVTDQGVSPLSKWAISTATIPGPSTPLLVRIGGVAYIYVGSTNGRLYQVEADNPAAIKFVLVRAGATIGAPAFDGRDSMIYVGSSAGAFYAVQAPLP
jgi:hypothetical protein